MSLGPGTSALTPTMLDPPRMAARVSTVRRQFDRVAPRFCVHDALPREIERRLLDRLDLIRLAPSRIVDVGCGGGILAESIARKGATVTDRKASCMPM